MDINGPKPDQEAVAAYLSLLEAKAAYELSKMTANKRLKDQLEFYKDTPELRDTTPIDGVVLSPSEATASGTGVQWPPVGPRHFTNEAR